MLKVQVSTTPEPLAPRLLKRFASALTEGLSTALSDAQSKAEDTAPVRTGNLRDSINTYFEGLRGEFVSDAHYSSYLHDGTGLYGPYKQAFYIYPRYKKALWWPGLPHPVPFVHIKGIEPMDFLRNATKPSFLAEIFEDEFSYQMNKKEAPDG